MAQFFVGDGVFANVTGFEPFPAVVENVVLNESQSSVYYHVKLLGSKETVALDGYNLLPFEENKKDFKLDYKMGELEKGAKMREEVLLGNDDEFPEVLMNFVTIDENFEEVSSEDLKRLGLANIVLSAPDIIKNIDEIAGKSQHSPRNIEGDEIIDVEEVSPADNELNYLRKHAGHSNSRKKRNYRSKCASRKRKYHGQLSGNIRSKLQARLENAKRKKQFFHKAQKDAIVDPQQDNKSRFGILEEVVGTGRKSSSKLSKQFKNDCSLSEDSSQSGGAEEKHNLLERERRAAIRSRFHELALTLNIPLGTSKVSTLATATRKISALQAEERNIKGQVARLKDLNLRLNARLFSLAGVH